MAGGLSFARVSVGFYHTCGVSPDNAAFCWGHNGSGQLGEGTAATISPLTRVTH